MFLVCGVVTVFFCILVVLFLPDNPMISRLSDKEKLLAIERLRSNKTGVENKTFNRAQMIEAFKDPNIWINGALSNYQADIIKSFGFTSKESALLSVPSGILSIIVCFSSAWVAGRTNQVLLTLIGFYPLGIIGAGLVSNGAHEKKADH
jgi:hypothetical protein